MEENWLKYEKRYTIINICLSVYQGGIKYVRELECDAAGGGLLYGRTAVDFGGGRFWQDQGADTLDCLSDLGASR